MKYLVLCITLLSALQNFAQQQQIDSALNQWHTAAEEADFDTYFGLMTTDAVFVGSDASEVWSFQEFKNFSQPYFEAGKAWTFKPVNRNVYTNEAQNMAWFDEVLNSEHMGLCRGSGVLIKTSDGKWKVKHFVLSVAVPNPLVSALVEQKRDLDQAYLQSQP